MQVDVLAMRSKVQRVHLQIKDICAILSGLVVAQNYKKGQQLITDRSFKVCPWICQNPPSSTVSADRCFCSPAWMM